MTEQGRILNEKKSFMDLFLTLSAERLRLRMA